MKINKQQFVQLMKEAYNKRLVTEDSEEQVEIQEAMERDPEQATKAKRVMDRALDDIESIRVNLLPKAKSPEDQERLRKKLAELIADYQEANGQYMFHAFGDERAMRAYVDGTARTP